jgi:hypothetical protein
MQSSYQFGGPRLAMDLCSVARYAMRRTARAWADAQYFGSETIPRGRSQIAIYVRKCFRTADLKRVALHDLPLSELATTLHDWQSIDPARMPSGRCAARSA